MKSIKLFAGAELRSEGLLEAGRDTERGMVQLGGDCLQGSIRQIELETGLHLQQWQLSITQPTQAQIASPDNQNRFFYLSYFFQTPPPLIFTIDDTRPQLIKKKPCLLFYSNSKPATIKFPLACSYHLIQLSFSHEWATRQTIKKGSSNDDALQSLLRIFRLPGQRVLTKGETIDAQQLYDDIDHTALSIELKLHTYSLLATLYRQATVPKEQALPNEHDAILPRVEKRILDSLYTTLPPLAELAEELHVSFSSLNRHFKARHGETIYDYYLRQKMMLALQLLQEHKQTVNAVAFRLGYESVTHFISMFKKIHGRSPGQMKGTEE